MKYIIILLPSFMKVRTTLQKQNFLKQVFVFF
jgi:hypothetical protein